MSFGPGINVGNIQVLNPTQLTASIAVTAAAAVGSRNVTATTGGEVAAIVDGFTVTAAPPPMLSSVTPSAGQQGETLLLTIVGENTHFTTDAPSPALTLGSNITIAPLTIVDDTTITASISIDVLANTGLRQGTLSSGATNFPVALPPVQPSGAMISGVSPASGPQGAVVAVTVTGQNTHWQQGTTSASFLPLQIGCPVVGVNTVTVESPTRVVLNLTIPPATCVGQQSFQVATGGEVLTASFGVYEQTPSLTLGPSTAMVGSTLTVNFLGGFTHFGALTTAVIDGTGVTLQKLPDHERGERDRHLPGGHRRTARWPHRDAHHTVGWRRVRGRHGAVFRIHHTRPPYVNRAFVRLAWRSSSRDNQGCVHALQRSDDGQASVLTSSQARRPSSARRCSQWPCRSGQRRRSVGVLPL